MDSSPVLVGAERQASKSKPDERPVGSSDTVLADLLGAAARNASPAAGRKRPTTARPRLQGDRATQLAQHGRRAGLELANSGDSEPDAAAIAREVLASGDELASPPTYSALDSKLRALSARDPKLAGMLDRGSSKGVEQALELERLRGELAAREKKMANINQMLREAQHETSTLKQKVQRAESEKAAVQRQMKGQEQSFRVELAKHQATFRAQVDSAHGEAAEVVAAAQQQLEAAELAWAEERAALERDTVAQVEAASRLADERVASSVAATAAARAGEDFSPGRRKAEEAADLSLQLDAQRSKTERLEAALSKERKRSKELAAAHGRRKQEEAAAGASRGAELQELRDSRAQLEAQLAQSHADSAAAAQTAAAAVAAAEAGTPATTAKR